MKRERATPRIWHTDWLVLRGISRILSQQMSSHMAKGATLVDLGCGDMPYRAMIEASGVSYMGADIDDGADIKIDAGGRVTLPDGAADAILSVQVLEHVRDLDAYCAEIRRLLRDDGTLFLSTHGTWLYHPHPEDHRRWTRTGLVHDLATRGLGVEEIHAIVGPLATTTMIRLAGYAYILRQLPIVGSALAATLAVLMNGRAYIEDAITPTGMRMDNACVYWVRAKTVSA
ncbi:MAG: methyltransferase domain-containing protein [Sphingopyxis sp.]